MNPIGQLQYFRSPVDGLLHPCAVCATDAGDEPMPLILDVSPGAIGNLPAAVALTEQIAGFALKHGMRCVALRPTGRGPGSVYQNYGEVDVLEAIEHACRNYTIDRKRITVTGASMGGAATWYLTSHYPDLFAGAATFCGYCDYRLWEKPGGLTFHMHVWEEPSWQARSAALLVENFRHTPMWIMHGDRDRSVGGGVPVEHSRRMDRLLDEQGFPHTYTERPGVGHGCRTTDVYEEAVVWLLGQVKPECPERVTLATFSLRHNTSYWVRIDQLARYPDRGLVDAAFRDEGQLQVQTENVRTLSLGPIPARRDVTLTLDGQPFGPLDLGERQTFQRQDDGSWRHGTVDLSGGKRHGVAGPVGDLFHEGTILVPGTTGTDDETFFNDNVANFARQYFQQRNGGVHRGGILGENTVELPLVPDAELTGPQRIGYNLLLYGTHATNAILKRYEGQLPLAFDGTTLRLAGKAYAADRVSVFAAFPHPENPGRYVAVHGGVTPDAVTWGSHLDMQLLPDYLVYSGGEVLDWGFWGNDWRPQAPE